MRLHLRRTMASLALCVLTGAAFADVTVSQSNAPTTLMGTEFASLFGAEHDTVNALPDAQLEALAMGPQRPKPGQGPAGGAGKAQDQKIDYSEAWLDSLPQAKGDKDWDCLRRAVYFEARGEAIQGQFAVAEVVLNRTDSPDFPKSVCSVVHAAGNGGCAFSYVCDGLADEMRDPDAAARAGKIARLMLDGAPRPLTLGATYFHARYARPGWDHLVQTAAIGGHLFYREIS